MLGAEVLAGGGVRFSVWAPRPRRVALRLEGAPGGAPGGARDLPMVRGPGDLWSLDVPAAGPGTRYWFVLDGERARPDPRARFLPDGVHGPAEVIDPTLHAWRHPRVSPSLEAMTIYELHVGAFTPEGTYRAAAAELPRLARELGITTVELMPVAAFPGGRNWGYDGVHLTAPVAAYGRPDDLRAFVDEAHGVGLSVLLDVVFNHLGPEGNYTAEFAPYFTSRRKTLWGDALDYARPEVRAWILDSALAWLREYRFDGLRVDAVHAMDDPSGRHVLAELTERARPAVLIAETDLNDVKVFDAWGFDACWSDDFHHALHACLTGERDGYYRGFGDAETLARAIEEGWVRGARPRRSRELPATRLVVASQTHDQIGNRALGERLAHLAGPAAARLAAVATLAAVPAVPLLFMGEEWAASSPFPYFTSHGDPELARAVSAGRRREFKDLGFAWAAQVPDPQDPGTFASAKLHHEERGRGVHAAMERLYRDLLALRRAHPGLAATGKERCRARAREGAVWVERGDAHLVVLNLDAAWTVRVGGRWRALLHSEDRRYGGALTASGNEVPPRSAAVFVAER